MAGLENVALPIRPHAKAVPRTSSLPRVLYALSLTPGHKFGSIEEQILILAERFRAEGSLLLPLFVCDPAHCNLDFFHSRDVPAVALDLRRFRWGRFRDLMRLVEEHRIDAIHWNFTSPLGNPYLWWPTALRPSLRHYFTDHISRTEPFAPRRGPLRQWLKRMLLRRYDKVFCVSDFVRDCLTTQAIWPDRLYTSLHFVNADRFRPDADTRHRLRRDLDARDRFVVLFVGQLIQAKGIDVLARAFARLPDEAVLWVIGDGAGRAGFDAVVAELGIAGRVRMLGHQFDVCPFMQAADCFACPSLWQEAAGLVNLEAAACGIPVVASRIGGIPEYLDHGRSGFLVEPGDAAALADRLHLLMREPALCRELGAQGRAMVLDRFATHARLPEVLELYRSSRTPSS